MAFGALTSSFSVERDLKYPNNLLCRLEKLYATIAYILMPL